MSTHTLLLVFLALAVLLVACAVIGILVYGTARLCGVTANDAVRWGAFVFFSALTLGIAVFSIILPALI